MLHRQVGSTARQGNSLRHCLTVHLLVQPVDDCTVGEDYTYAYIQMVEINVLKRKHVLYTVTHCGVLSHYS